MTAKNYLSQAYWLDKRIDAKLEQLDSLRSLAMKATSALSDMPRGANANPHRTEDVLAKIADMSTDVEREIDRLVDLKRDIGNAIESVDDPDARLLLELRYVNFKTWIDIAATTGFCRRHIYRLHDAALNKIMVS
jgi:DNA-directed RNA polymerase specialized sigma subunit